MTAVYLDEELLLEADCVVIHTDHSVFDYASIARTASLVIDTRNATAGLSDPHIVRL